MNVTRRGFLQTMLALGAAPAIVSASSLMPVRQLFLPTFDLAAGTVVWSQNVPMQRLILGDSVQVTMKLPRQQIVQTWKAEQAMNVIGAQLRQDGRLQIVLDDGRILV